MIQARSRMDVERSAGAVPAGCPPAPDGGGRPSSDVVRAGVLGAALALVGCSAGTGEAVPIPDPGQVARQRLGMGPERPQRVLLTWDYADPRGPVRGDGVLRFNPPDSLRLDLFGPGDGSMAAALAGSGLRSAGQIQDVRLPPAPFLYASAGLFRPPDGGPEEGYRSGEQQILIYVSRDGSRLRYYFGGRRLRRLEERRGGRTVRELDVRWPEEGGPWPSSAEYRDRERESRARWRLEEAQPVETPFPREIYDLPRVP